MHMYGVTIPLFCFHFYGVLVVLGTVSVQLPSGFCGPVLSDNPWAFQ